MTVDFGIEDDAPEVKPKDFDLQFFLKNTNQHFRTEAEFRTWVRSGLRSAFWNDHPVKMEFLKLNKVKIPNPSPNPRKGAELIWGYECNICGCQMRATPTKYEKKQYEVDHMVGENSLKSLDDFVDYFKNLVFVTSQDLQILCKPCHGIKTYMERYNVTWNKAAATKRAKQAMKDLTYKSELAKFGYTETMTKVDSEKALILLYEQELNGGDSG